MIRSRVTLATTEAAAIEKLSASPLTTVCTAQVSGGAITPSTSAVSGRTPSTATARAIAKSAARRMFRRSISPALAAPPERTVAGLALGPGQHFRIIEPVTQHFREPAGLEDHRSGDHRPGQRPSPDLIDAAHQSLALTLDREIRHRLSAPLGLCHDARQLGKRAGGRRDGTGSKHRYVGRLSMLASPTVRCRPVPRPYRTGAFLLGALAALYLLATSPAGAFDLFATHQVTAQFATPDGKPMANAEVRAFAPSELNNPAVTGHTDA